MTDWKDLRGLTLSQQWQKVLSETHFARTMAARYAAKALGVSDTGDHEDKVPDDIGVTRLGDDWYVTATWGDGPDHDHYEIRLDATRLSMLMASLDVNTSTAAYDAGYAHALEMVEHDVKTRLDLLGEEDFSPLAMMLSDILIVAAGKK